MPGVIITQHVYRWLTSLILSWNPEKEALHGEK